MPGPPSNASPPCSVPSPPPLPSVPPPHDSSSTCSTSVPTASGPSARSPSWCSPRYYSNRSMVSIPEAGDSYLIEEGGLMYQNAGGSMYHGSI